MPTHDLYCNNAGHVGAPTKVTTMTAAPTPEQLAAPRNCLDCSVREGLIVLPDPPADPPPDEEP